MAGTAQNDECAESAMYDNLGLARITPATADTRFLITFIPQPLPVDFKLPLVSPKNDFEILRATSGEVFIVMRLVNGRPGNPAAFIEKTCQVKTTTRFFGTTAKMLQAAKSG
jgi:hypothetical protein